MSSAYRLPGYRHGWVAAYRPEYRQVWTNPKFSREEINSVLCEEFVHATLTQFHPAELLPLRNYLTGSSRHPRHDEFSDIVEAVYYASHPLAFGEPVDPDHPLDLYSPHRALGRRILRAAAQLAKMRSPQLEEGDALQKALWALTAGLGCIVPLAKGQGNAVLDVLSDFGTPQRWRSESHLLGMLLMHLSLWIKERPERATFTLTRPNDPHELLVKSTAFLCDFAMAPIDRIIPTTPLLLSTLTLGLYNHVYLFWLLPRDSRIDAVIEEWSFTAQNITASLKALRRRGISANSPTPDAVHCKAGLFHMNCLVFLRDLLRRRPVVSPPFLVHEMLELFTYLLREIILCRSKEEYECPLCRIAFDGAFQENAKRIAGLSVREKQVLIEAASRHILWLHGDCLGEIRRCLRLRKEVNFRRHVAANLQTKPDLPYAVPAYSFPCEKGSKWAEFLPALGQIWVFPDCPESLLELVLDHEKYHYNTCALQPSHLLPLRHALLCRPLPEPDRFNDIMEASYVLGLTLAAGLPPAPEFFPPSTGAPRRLAERLALRAQSLATTAAPSLDSRQASIEAGKALLTLMHHVVPRKTGAGARIVGYIEKINPTEPWSDQWHLWQQLYRECHTRLMNSRKATPFTLALPMDPHRLVPEMLIFLAHALAPIPERREAVLMTFPALVNVLTLASATLIPVIRLTGKGNERIAEISSIRGDAHTERLVQAAAGVQSARQEGLHKRGIDCICTQFYADFLRDSAPLRLSQKPHLHVKLIECVIRNVKSAGFQSQKTTCRWCEETLKAPTVRQAIEAVDYLLPKEGRALVKGAEHYEKWLLSKGVKLMGRICGFKEPLEVRRSDQFL